MTATTHVSAATRVPAVTGRSRKVAGVDRIWGQESVVVTLGPLVVPTRASWIDAVRRFAANPSMTRVGRLLDAQCRTWRLARDPVAFAEACVTDLGPDDSDDPAERVVRIMRQSRGDLSFRIFLGRTSVSMSVAHAFADGYSMTRLLAGLASTAVSGQAPAWVEHEPVDHPLATGIGRYFVRHPDRVRALAGRRPAVGSPVGGPPQPDTGVIGWTPSPACRLRVSSGQALRDLKDWRRAHAPGVSTIPLTIAATEFALRKLGQPTTSAPLVVFDARRYLEGNHADILGNFCSGLRLPVPDRADPVALHHAIQAAVAGGRPLAVLALAVARARGRSFEPAQERPVSAPWDLAYTHMAKPREIAALTFSGGGSPYYMGILTPAGPFGVTLGFTEIGDRINAFASFHDNAVEPAQVEQLLELLSADPRALLEEWRQSVTPSEVVQAGGQ